ncbi:MAG: hypothetical protein COA47_05090 [Robiginitomaculum sp.]|nr:MAG: hypothetical protein COA47_05090 [Robiginitomaculum sp.]
MKIDPHAALLAAQNLRTSELSARGRSASANFFAELRKAEQGNTAGRTAQVASSVKTETVKPEIVANVSRSDFVPVREAPMRGLVPARPLPPGSLLNILV